MSSISGKSDSPIQRPGAMSCDKMPKQADVKTSRARAKSLPENRNFPSQHLRATWERSPLDLLKKEGVTRADLDKFPKSAKDAAASVQKSSTSPQLTSIVKALQTSLNKLWETAVTPVLAALATGGFLVYNIVKTTIKAAFLPIVCLTKLFIALCSKVSGKNFDNAQKITTKFIVKTVMEFTHDVDLPRHFKTFDKSFKSFSLEEIIKYFEFVKRDSEEVANFLSMSEEEHDVWRRSL